MANKDDLYVVTHRVTAERITPKEEEGMGVGGMIGVGLVIFVLLGLLGAFLGPCP
jgi:hypothetical protein